MMWRRRGRGGASGIGGCCAVFPGGQKSAKFDLVGVVCDVHLWGRRRTEVAETEGRMEMNIDMEEEGEADEVETGSRDEVLSSRAGTKSAKFDLVVLLVTFNSGAAGGRR